MNKYPGPGSYLSSLNFQTQSAKYTIRSKTNYNGCITIFILFLFLVIINFINIIITIINIIIIIIIITIIIIIIIIIINNLVLNNLIKTPGPGSYESVNSFHSNGRIFNSRYIS
jgi:hypothetical protein